MADITHLDYEWTKTTPEQLYSFCLTYISNAEVTDVVEALPTVGQAESWNLETLSLKSNESWDEISDDNLLVGLVRHGTWTIMYEHNGYVGTNPQLMEPLSAGREIVAHTNNAGGGTFFLYADGQTKTWFEPLFASRRGGTEPNLLLSTMEQVGGFALDLDERTSELHHREATFALCDAITGIRLVPTLLREATFTVVEVVNRPGTPAAADRSPRPIEKEVEAQRNQAIRGWARQQGFG